MTCLLCAVLVTAAPQPTYTAIQTERVVTVTAGIVENGVLLIKDGKIVKIAPRLDLPEGTTVIDASSLTAYPGMVLAGTSLGIDRSAGGSADAVVTEGMWPYGRTYDRVLESGFTALGLVPSRGGLFSGKGAVVRPLGRTTKEIVLGNSEFLCMDFSASYTSTLARSLSQPKGTIAEAVSGRINVVLTSRDANSTLHLLEAIGRLRTLRCSIRQQGDVVNALPSLIRAKRTCIVPASVITKPNTDFEVNVAATLSAAKIPLCLVPRSGSVSAMESFRFDVARLLRSGVPAEVALRGVTIMPATVLGIEWRIGSLEEGKDADVLLMDGTLFDPRAHIERIMIAGETVFKREAAE